MGRSDAIASGSAALLNKQHAAGQRAQYCFSFINWCLSNIVPSLFLTSEMKEVSNGSTFFFLFRCRGDKGKTNLGFSYHPRAIAS